MNVTIDTVSAQIQRDAASEPPRRAKSAPAPAEGKGDPADPCAATRRERARERLRTF